MLLNYVLSPDTSRLVSHSAPEGLRPFQGQCKGAGSRKPAVAGSEQHTDGKQLPPLQWPCKMEGRDGTCHHHGNPLPLLRHQRKAAPAVCSTVCSEKWLLNPAPSYRKRGLFMRSVVTDPPGILCIQEYRQPLCCPTSCCNSIPQTVCPRQGCGLEGCKDKPPLSKRSL